MVQTKHTKDKNFFQSLTNYITSIQNIIIWGDFIMVLEFRDKMRGTICSTHLVGFVSLKKQI